MSTLQFGAEEGIVSLVLASNCLAELWACQVSQLFHNPSDSSFYPLLMGIGSEKNSATILSFNASRLDVGSVKMVAPVRF